MSVQNHITVKPTNFQLSERQVAERIGEEYMEMDVNGPSPDVKQAADMLAKTNEYLYKRIGQEGVSVEFTENDPYDSFEEMCKDIEENQQMLIFSGGTQPEHMSKQENLINRAVHDYWGHYKNNVGFNFWGEFQKWHHMRQYYSESVNKLTAAEVIGQTGVAWYLEGGFNSPKFVQKPIMAPESWIEMCYEHCPVDVKR